MKRTDIYFREALEDATDCLMREFVAWNEIQAELRHGGYANNHYCEQEIAHKRGAFRAIAERFVLEDVDYRRWEWFETPWAGTDGNNGGEAYVIDFVMMGVDEPEMGILGFYVTRNHRFWHALPLTEFAENGNLAVYEVNDIQTAINILECGLGSAEIESEAAES